MKQIEVVNKGTNAETAVRLALVPETAIRLAPANEIAERLDRIENSFPAIVDRLNRLEKKLSTSFKISCKRLDGLEDDTHTHALYAGTAVPITKDDAEGGSW